MDLLHAAPFQGIIPRPYLKGTANKLLDISPKAASMKQRGGLVSFRKLPLVRRLINREAYILGDLYPRGFIS